MVPVKDPGEENVALGSNDGVDKRMIGTEHLWAIVGEHGSGGDCNCCGGSSLAPLLVGLEEGLLELESMGFPSLML